MSAVGCVASRRKLDARGVRRVPLVAAAGLTTLGLLLSACTSSGSGGATSGAASGGATSAGRALAIGATLKSAPLSDGQSCTASKAGGNLTLAGATQPGSTDPVSPAPGGNAQLAAVYDTLMTYDYEAKAYKPWIAKSLTSDAAHETWTLTLNPKVTYGDGSAMTAAVVKTSIERFKATPNAFSAQIALIKSIDATNPTTVVFHLASAWGTFPFLLTQQPGMIVNTKVVAAATKLTTSAPADAGVGPYTVKSFTAGGSFVATAKSNWWGGPVCIKQITFQSIYDGPTMLNAFKSGTIQAFLTLDSSTQKQMLQAGDRQIVLPQPITSPIFFKVNKGGPTADPQVRQAIQYALNTDAINQRVYNGVGLTSTAIVAPGLPGAPTVKPLGYDAAKAKSLVDAAKKRLNWDGKLDYTYTVGSIQQNLAIITQSLLKQVGITLTLHALQQSKIIQQVYVQRNFQTVQWALQPDPACVWCALTAFKTADPGNIGGYSNAQMDAALDTLRMASTDAEVTAATNAIQLIVNQTVPEASAGQVLWSLGVSPKLHGLKITTQLGILFDHAYLG
jgi:peptide/nickel transport system substrate-binding protein